MNEEQNIQNEAFARSTALLGDAGMQRLSQARVILFGVGGVGSWCAECLIRTGVQHLTIVDNDVVMPSNLNRQLMATRETLGQPKVEAMRQRLLSINPQADIVTRQEAYSPEAAESFRLDTYDFIIDAIDSLAEKAHLILQATQTQATFVSAMGAALKLDPTRVRVDEFWKAKGCPLARALRNRFKRDKTFPARKFRCVYSDEPAPVQETSVLKGGGAWDHKKAQINGSLAQVVAVWGLTLASLVVNACRESAEN